VVDALIRVTARWGVDETVAAEFAATAATFASDVICTANGRHVNGKDAMSVMSVMSLRARRDTPVRILVAGPDERDALHALSAILSASKCGALQYMQPRPQCTPAIAER
jgi:phosphotransferase system HPr (HPr) family protein